MAVVIGQTLRAWIGALLSLVAAGAGMSALTASSTSTSQLRMALAAGVLSAYVAAVALVCTARPARTRWRCLFWGASVPSLVGLATVAVVLPTAGWASALLSALPWVLGAGVVSVPLGVVLPTLHRPRWAIRRRQPLRR